jgi:hypothetical protein
MTFEEPRISVSDAMEQTRRAFDVGEHEGDGPLATRPRPDHRRWMTSCRLDYGTALRYDSFASLIDAHWLGGFHARRRRRRHDARAPSAAARRTPDHNGARPEATVSGGRRIRCHAVEVSRGARIRDGAHEVL